MSYKTLGYSLARQIVANCDKCSANGHGKTVNSPWGAIRMCGYSKRHKRLFTISGSTFFRNGGLRGIGSLRGLLLGVGA